MDQTPGNLPETTQQAIDTTQQAAQPGTGPSAGADTAAEATAEGSGAATRVKRRRHRSRLQLPLVALALALLVLVGTLVSVVAALNGTIQGLFTVTTYNNTPPAGSFSVVRIVGTIRNTSGNALGVGDPSYNHSATLSHIQLLAETEDNTGILLYMDTSGGGVYESDEVYLALMDYKEKTGRPVWAYMAGTCASGGYYICAAADYIMANRNTTTGSIGVYIQLTDTSGLYDKLGIETVLVRSGNNKGTGVSGVPITNSQRQVYQDMVDEYYERFVQLVADGRGMKLSEVRPLADGRVFTATRALENGLIDALGNWDTILAAFAEESGGTAFYPNFSRKSTIGQLLGTLQDLLPTGEAEAALDYAEELENGVPMMQYNP